MRIQSAELTSARLHTTRSGSRVLLVSSFALCAALPSMANAAPSGQFVGGAAAGSITPGATTTVTQIQERAVVNWTNFNVGKTELVVFAQPSARSVLLNRISGGKTTIEGTVNANGRIFLVNTRGIVFAAGAHVNVGSLVAMTADIDPTEFSNGSSAFRTVSPTTSTILNQGTITADPGGSVLLLAPGVVNQGTISAKGGSIVLATGRAFLVDLFGDGLVQIATAAVTGQPSGGITQIGHLEVGAGTVLVRRAFGAASLVGTLNAIPVSELASQAISLPGGAIAFVGASSPPTATLNPNWIKPSTGSGGGGIIDASPIYGLDAPAAAVAHSALLFAPPPVGQNARLAEFNKLGEIPPEHAAPSGTDSAGTELASGALYTIGEPGRALMTQVVGFTPEQSPGAAALESNAESGKRRCTVAELLRQGCR
jgi:filamentous hemagglutinin family protein